MNQSIFRNSLVALILTCLIAGVATAQTTQPTEPNRPVPYGGPELVELMKRVMNYQVDAYTRTSPAAWVNWQAAPFWAGVMASYRVSGDPAFLEATRQWAEKNQWKVGRRTFHADDIAVGQAYLELYLKERDPKMIEDVKSRVDQYFNKKEVTRGEVGGLATMTSPSPWSGKTVWWWCDALFMAPPVMTQLHAATGDQKYLDLMHSLYWDTTGFLFDYQEGLFYRDERFFFDKMQSPTGKKVFWGRGNGWVYAGLIRLLDHLPANDPYRENYLKLYRQMTDTLIKYQGEDGMWRSSVNDPAWVPVGESSSTGFFCYGIMAGVNRGYLDREKYLPAALRAWKGLCGVVNPNGSVGFTQEVGDKPVNATPESVRDYSQGAFLLSASEVYISKPSPAELAAARAPATKPAE